MNFKQRVIKTIDILLYACFAIVFAIAAIGVMSSQVGTALIFLVVGWIVLCVLSGTWFVLSSIADNANEQTEILKQIQKQTYGQKYVILDKNDSLEILKEMKGD